MGLGSEGKGIRFARILIQEHNFFLKNKVIIESKGKLKLQIDSD